MVASVGAGLVPALCSRLLFWAPIRDAPTVSVLCYLYSVLFRADTPVPPLWRCSLLGTHKGCPYGICTLLSVLFALLGGHAGTAPTVSVLFWAPTRDAPTALYSVLY